MKTGMFTTEGTEGTEVKSGDIYHEPHEITRKNKNRWQWMFALHANIRCQYLLSCLFVFFVVKKCIFLCSFVCFVDDKRILIYGGCV